MLFNFYLLGYCMKDHRLGHFKYIVLNLTREMRMAEISAHNGVSAAASIASINNATTSLARNNWFNNLKVMKYTCVHKAQGPKPSCLPNVYRDMDAS